MAMTRRAALQIFGLDERASDAAIRAAYSALRSHLESRERAASSMQRAGALAFYREQLRELDLALDLATGVGMSSAISVDRAQGDSAVESGLSEASTGLRLWASRGVLLLAFLIVVGWGWASIAPSGGSTVGVSTAPSGRPAQLRLRANLVGASAQIIDASSTETVWRGPADGQPRAVPGGEYRLVVEHPKCPDRWSDEVRLSPGQEVDRLAHVCAEHVMMTVRANVPGARLTIDGREVVTAEDSEVTLPAGLHRVRVDGEGHETWEASIDLAAGSRVSMQANLVPRRVPPTPPAPAVASAPTRKRAQDPVPKSEEERRTHEWHRTAREYLLSRYDRDRSGDLNTLAELESVPCSDWQGLEQSFDAGGLALSMTRFYGFDGSKWVENAFGVTNEMRGGAYLHLKDCGLR